MYKQFSQTQIKRIYKYINEFKSVAINYIIAISCKNIKVWYCFFAFTLRFHLLKMVTSVILGFFFLRSDETSRKMIIIFHIFNGLQLIKMYLLNVYHASTILQNQPKFLYNCLLICGRS